ncbi:MAG: HD domain-containing protein [Candidatus Margulisiibacteriota bacterium]
MFDIKLFPKSALKIIKELNEKGFAGYFVGGCVRDLLLGAKPHEWDLATDAAPQEVAAIFSKVVPTGVEFGTVTVILGEGKYEVTTFRSDERYKDGRHPTKVNFTRDIHLDLSRRDFTVNAMAYEPFKKELIDDFSGRRDIAKSTIRAVGKAKERFLEDGLRSIRACRFAAQLNFKIEAGTFKAISTTLKVTKKVAFERIHDELVKLLMGSDKPSVAFEYMRRSGLLKLIMPELLKTYKIKQPRQYHKYDVYWHSLHAMDAAPRSSLVLRLAALLHDIAKPRCKKGHTFYNHDLLGAKIAEKTLRRLKFSNEVVDRVCLLIKNHMFYYTSEWTDAAVRRFIRRVGLANIPDLFAVRKIDKIAMETEIGDDEYLDELRKRIDRVVADQNALHIKDLKINGRDVMKTLKIAPGPKVGKVLGALLERVLDEPARNDRKILLEMVKEYAD